MTVKDPESRVFFLFFFILPEALLLEEFLTWGSLQMAAGRRPWCDLRAHWICLLSLQRLPAPK